MSAKKLVGEISWHEDGYAQVEIERAFLRDNGDKLVLDFVYDGRRHYLDMQRRSENQYSGSCEQATRKETWQVQAFGRLYSYGNQHVLVGSWREGELYQWVVELQEVDHFPDESSKA